MTHELPTSEGARRVPATLVYDTKAQPMPSGVRAVMLQRTRRMLFAADETELALQISSSTAPERLKVAGQVLDDGVPVEGASISFVGARRLDAATDKDGEFWVDDLPLGEYALAIGMAGRIVDISPFSLS